MSTTRLQDLAAATGLHVMTVSRAVRNVGRMRQETRQRILEAARRMNYRPHAAAAAMRTGRTGCIALLASAHPADSCLPPAALLALSAEVARRGGYLAHAVLPAPAPDAPSRQPALPRLLARRLVEGVLLDCAPEQSAPLESFLRRNRIPVLLLRRLRAAGATQLNAAAAVRAVAQIFMRIEAATGVASARARQKTKERIPCEA